MEFVFHINGCPAGDWEQQLALALEKRNEAHSRQSLPGLWRTIDRLGTPKMSEPVLRRRRIRYKIYGVILILLGLFLLIPGLMKPEELTVPLLVGLFATGTGILQLLPRRKRPGKSALHAAGQLLKTRSAVSALTVRFDEQGIADAETPISFETIETIVEMPDLYLVCWANKGLVLWKQELTTASPEDFTEWLSDRHTVLHG
jgi:hypothetical protein